MKLDHIGDFVTALPAIRRLKADLSAASIHVLASRAARAFADIEHCIDEFIEFDFFHAVSQLGPKEITEEDYQSLRARLAPYRFDLAVDLRKHLRYPRRAALHAGARSSPAMTTWASSRSSTSRWNGKATRTLQRKRSHVDGRPDQPGRGDRHRRRHRTARGCRCGGPAGGIPDFLPAEARALFVKPVVAVHPGVGNVMRQWPAEHFAALIDLLIEKNGVNVVLIGGPDEAELAEEVLAQVLRRDAVVSLVGKTSLASCRAAARLRAVYRQQQRTEAYRRGAWRADDRHPFRRGRCDRMGADRPARGRAPAQHDVQPVLSGAAGGLPARLRLHARAGADVGARGRRDVPGAAGGVGSSAQCWSRRNREIVAAPAKAVACREAASGALG